jgi:hypothetical protein
MSLAAAIYSDDYDWISDSAHDFTGNLLRMTYAPRNENEVQYCVYNQTVHSRSSLFVVVRGSSTQEDFDGNFNVREIASNGTYFHMGFHSAASWLLEQIDDLISTWDGYIFFVGHSRGGAVSTTAHALAQFTYPRNTNFFSLCFAPPPAIADMGMFTELDIYDHMFSFVYTNDPIPRFSIQKVNDDFDSPSNEAQMLASIIARLNIMMVHPFAQKLMNSAMQKRGVLFAAMQSYQENPSSIHIKSPQGRVYLMLEKNFGNGLTSSRIGPGEENVVDALGPLGFTLGNLLHHLESNYLDWINHIGDHPMCTTEGESGVSCSVTPVCVNGTGLVNVTYCEKNSTNQEVCATYETCGEEPDLEHCGEDYQWECGNQPTCALMRKKGAAGSFASCGDSAPSSRDDGLCAPGGSCGAKGSCGFSRDEKCSEQLIADDAAIEVLGTRITRAFLGIKAGEVGWWKVLNRVSSVFGDSSRFYHTSLWLGTERKVGFLLHYGAYSPRNENESKLFFEGDGAHFRPMTLADYQKDYTSFELRELRVRNPMRMSQLWDELHEEGPWTRNAYGWSGHNCQHFTNRVRDILQLELRESDIGNPKEIPEVLKALREPL